MRPDPTHLLEIAGIEAPPIGFYDVPDRTPFEPFAEMKRCMFSCHENWLKGERISIAAGDPICRGGNYWIGEVEFMSRDDLATALAEREGFKSVELMKQWLDNQKPYIVEHRYVVMGPLVDGYDGDLKTITFFVNPDQLSLLLLGTETKNASMDVHPTFFTFGSGYGRLAALFRNIDPDAPKALIGATDIAMRHYLPPDILALTVNKPMYRQLCSLGEDSFLYKSLWKGLAKARAA